MVLATNIKSHLFVVSAMYYIMTGHEMYKDVPDDEVTAKYKRKEFPDVKVLKCGSTIEGC